MSWTLGLVDSRAAYERRHDAEAGVDGCINFFDDNSGRPKRVIVQVKSGHVNRGMIATHKSDMEREMAEIDMFITLQPPTEPMRQEALPAGIHTSERVPDQQHPCVQTLTIDELLGGDVGRGRRQGRQSSLV